MAYARSMTTAPTPQPSTAPRPRLENVLAIARMLVQYENSPELEKMCARWVVETFGEDMPCGMPEPEVYPGAVIITRDMVGQWEPDDAIALAKLIIVGAERARSKGT